jgi:predicted ATPase/DNA-binding CsgD family transcriptional regulator
VISARERQVLGLLAAHLTNAEIAEQLVVSVRTVESHVSSLIRKLGAPDRRALVRLAESRGLLRAVPPPWPAPASSFIGRDAETDHLRSLVREHRLVTVTGPGGVGKTRLTLQALGGGWFVDLARIATGVGVVPAVAAAVGATDRPGSTLEDTLLAALRDAEGPLVLDNCEHVLEAVAALITRLLASSPGLRVVATSRAPLRTAEEWVYETPQLSPADALQLFRARARAAGGVVPDDQRARELCERLEHLALALELAAAHYPALGMDGLTAALAAPLQLLRSGGRGSLRDTIAWSVALLDDEARAAFGAVHVFAAPFSAAAAHAVALPDATLADAARVLVTLADQHLLSVEPGSPTTYRFQEVVRQYAAELDEAGRARTVEAHLDWAASELAVLAEQEPDDGWCDRFDTAATEVRAALSRRLDPVLGELLAEQLVRRGLLEEAQQWFERLASADQGQRTRLLRLAAGAAAARLVGDETMRLLDEAAASGNHEEAADALAWSVVFAAFHPGMMATWPTEDEIAGRLAQASELAPAGSAAEVAVAAAASMCLRGCGQDVTAAARDAAERAAAQKLPLLASAALDCVCSSQLARGEYQEALASVAERGRHMDPLPLSAATAYPFNDYLLMGCEVSLAAGDLDRALHYAERLEALPCYRDAAHPALARRVQVDALLGDYAGAVARGERLLDSWCRAGRHPAATLAVGAYAVAFAHGALGDASGRATWTGVAEELLGRSIDFRVGWAPTLDAMLLLNHGRAREALVVLAAPLDDPLWDSSATQQMWRPWYAAAWAQAAAATGHRDLSRAVAAACGNRHASALIASLEQRVAGARTPRP